MRNQHGGETQDNDENLAKKKNSEQESTQKKAHTAQSRGESEEAEESRRRVARKPKCGI